MAASDENPFWRDPLWRAKFFDLAKELGDLGADVIKVEPPGGDPFLGQPEVINANDYLSGGRQFGPTITSANITPDFAGKPAGLTRAEFITMMRTGHNPKDPAGQILQVMPWPAFGKKTTEDLHAIYEYLRAIPSLPDNTHPGP